MPTACHGWAETVAAYRFLHTSASGVQEILSGHPHAPLERIRTPEVVLLGHETPCLHDGTTPPKAGRGPVKSKTRAASLRQLTVAFPPARAH
jgi:hypothetical protein